ncbi:TMEM14-domain-containing protein [Gigaspora margarita]|uniref:TMEM14-domain-containing protein n=1 Tax=Gigaspora margarita TaxID=4874 RepID=A0A8H3X4Q4_GIGMA|nr:TMEM14-domain-containing protein [Gigaspora margarita]
MHYHPAYAMAVLCTVGGIAGYASKKSVPSIVSGVGIGMGYAVGGYLIQKEKSYGNETALVASILLGGVMIPRMVKYGRPIPLSLSILSVGIGTYYGKKVYDNMVYVKNNENVDDTKKT